MIKSYFCTHPQGIVPICACGMNAVCPICGFGRGAAPCNCNQGMTDDAIKIVVEKYKNRFSAGWEKLGMSSCDFSVV